MKVNIYWARIEPYKFDEKGNVLSWALGLKAEVEDLPEGMEPVTAYIDGEVPVPEDKIKPPDQWTEDELRDFAWDYATKEEYTEDPETGEREYTKENWIKVLQRQIQAKLKSPKFRTVVSFEI